ncbi:glycosyltransferase family 4 protein [Candidatus Gracilibacteria bacterium]|nr:glycosyltransferase family 4 protein [Candidatus Gracilibacteria bacterium]
MARIGIDCRFFSLNNGIGRYIGEITRRLVQNQNHDFVFFVNENNKTLFQEFIGPAKYELIVVNAKHYSIAEQLFFPTKIYKAKLDLMHFTNFNRPLFYFKKTIVTIHDLTLHFYPGNKLNKPWHRIFYHLVFYWSLLQAKQILTVSETTKQDINHHYPQFTHKTTTIHLGITSEFLNQNTTPNYKKNFLLYAGNWRIHKNLTNLLKAFQILKNKFNYKGKLLITGQYQPGHTDIQKLSSELKLTNEIVLLGTPTVNELKLFYEQAEAYIIPSFYEGFGLPALEAMQAKTVPIVSNQGSLPEICGDAAIYFNPHNPNDIAEKIHNTITNPLLTKELISKGQKHLQKFSYDLTAKKTLNIYEQYVQGLPKPIQQIST